MHHALKNAIYSDIVKHNKTAAFLCFFHVGEGG